MGGEGHSRVHTFLALSCHTGARMAGNLSGDLVSMVREWFSGRTPEIWSLRDPGVSPPPSLGSWLDWFWNLQRSHHTSGIVLVHDPDIIHTSMIHIHTDIHQHTPPNSPSVPIKRMAQVAGERRGWGSAESIRVWAEFIKTTQVTVLVISLSYRV